MEHDVFISYSRKDVAVVDEIRKLFEANAISYWMDVKKLHGGSVFMGDLVEAIKNSKIVLFISSSSSNNSKYTAKEVALAFNEGKYIIPYKIDNATFSQNLQFVMSDLNCIEAIPFSTHKAMELVADIKSLLSGTRQDEVRNIKQREYIDISQWNKPRSKFGMFVSKIFEDKNS